jgi:hypothetical protein
MPWKIEVVKPEPNGKVEQIAENTFKVTFSVCNFCPGCISQIIVSKCKDTYCSFLERQAGCYNEVTFTLDPATTKEVWVATDLQYTISDAIRNYPNNVHWHIYWVSPAPAIPWWIIAIPVVGVIAWFIYKKIKK